MASFTTPQITRKIVALASSDKMSAVAALSHENTPPQLLVEDMTQCLSWTKAEASLQQTPEVSEEPEDDRDDGIEGEESHVALEGSMVNIGESSSEKRQREEEESERLVWELMRQESMEAYRIQMEYMRQNAHEMNSEDLSMIQMLMDEQGHQEAPEEEEAPEGEQPEADVSNSEEWDYDRLIELGNELGDVKTERWKLRAKAVIRSLPKKTFEELELASTATTAGAGAEADGVRTLDRSCAVCMETYEATEVVCQLPCCHYFHQACTERWLEERNNCPLCKLKVSATP